LCNHEVLCFGGSDQISVWAMEDAGAVELLNSLRGDGPGGIQNDAEIERRRKHMTHAIWRPQSALAEVVRQTGTYWKNHGFHREGKDYLNPEETMYLVEKDRVFVEYNSVVMQGNELYAYMLKCIPHACYLAYLRLKVNTLHGGRCLTNSYPAAYHVQSLEYIIVRHTSELRCFDADQQIYGTLYYSDIYRGQR
jgi:hypothetical protein